MHRLKNNLLYVMALLYIAAGINHFWHPVFFGIAPSRIATVGSMGHHSHADCLLECSSSYGYEHAFVSHGQPNLALVAFAIARRADSLGMVVHKSQSE
jgi:hypothetical protein